MHSDPAYLPPRRERDLPQGIPDEMRPRRDHILRLLYLATAGGFPAMIALSLYAGHATDPPAAIAVAVCAVVGYLVGRLQARWLWEGMMPGRFWGPWTALGWALGSALWIAAAHLTAALSRSHGVAVVDLLQPVATLACGAVAGGVSAAQQARVLHWRDLDSGWWIAASAGANALGWTFWLLAGWTGEGTSCF